MFGSSARRPQLQNSFVETPPVLHAVTARDRNQLRPYGLGDDRRDMTEGRTPIAAKHHLWEGLQA
jgi:hypothetical protein